MSTIRSLFPGWLARFPTDKILTLICDAEALALIRAARPIVLPNPGYLKQLTQELELKILGSSSMTPQSNEFTAAVSVEPVSAS
jgi:hypothetical protein